MAIQRGRAPNRRYSQRGAECKHMKLPDLNAFMERLLNAIWITCFAAAPNLVPLRFLHQRFKYVIIWPADGESESLAVSDHLHSAFKLAHDGRRAYVGVFARAQ
eukprot:6177846-Pleurochrysis_carterae.AAC.2